MNWMLLIGAILIMVIAFVTLGFMATALIGAAGASIYYSLSKGKLFSKAEPAAEFGV